MKRVVLAVLAAMLVLASPAAAAEPSLSWSAPQTVAPDAITDVDCPTTGFCVATDVEGNVVTTANPVGSAAGWTAADIYGARLSSVSCASPSLCVAAGREGNLLVSTNPTGGAAAWTPTKVAGTGDLKAVDCAVGVCGALDAQNRILLSSNPTGGAGAWIVAESSSISLSAIDCPDSSLCVAVGHAPRSLGGGLTVQENLVVTVSEPTKPAMAFKNSFIGFRTFLQAVSCPTAAFCLAVDQEGYAWPSTDPRGGEGAWSEVSIAPSEELIDVSCPTASFCAALGASGRALTSANPAGGAADWGSTGIALEMSRLSCPSTSLCLAAGEREVIVGTPVVTPGAGPQPPAWTPPAWTPPRIPAGRLGFGRTSRLAVEGGKVKVPFSCAGASSCHGNIKLRAGKLTIGSAGFFVPVGRTKMVPVRLNRKGRQLFEDKSKVRAQAILDSRGTSDAANMRKSFLLERKR